jgi:preprotein translocase subunit SecE
MVTPARPGSAARKPGFFADILGELRKVVWPTRQETIYLTMMVLVVAIAVGAFLGGLDYIYSFLINHFILK